MNSIEEQLWDYIDGICTPEQQEVISRLIDQDNAYRTKYNELLTLNTELSKIELDHPSMAFTYNVMEQIRTEAALKPLKASIDIRIVKGIAAFFILSITTLVIIALSQTSWGHISFDLNFKIPQYKLPDLTNIFSNTAMQAFLFFDVILGLYLFDAWLRRKKTIKTV